MKQPEIWERAMRAAAVLAVNPAGIGGVDLRAPAGPVRDAWLSLLHRVADGRVRKMPAAIDESRLLGGLDLGATLSGIAPVASRGFLAEADGQIVVAAMAERMPASTAAHLAATLDTGIVIAERDGLSLKTPACIAVVAFDEGEEEGERTPAALRERLAIVLDLRGLSPRDVVADEVFTRDGELETPSPQGRVAPKARGGVVRSDHRDTPHSRARATRERPPLRGGGVPDDLPREIRSGFIVEARRRLPQVSVEDAVLSAFCTAAAALGIASLRAPLQALHVARALAALDDCDTVGEAHAREAAALVLAPRATQMPAPPEQEEQPDDAPADEEPSDTPATIDDIRPLDDVILEAAQAALPPGLLAKLAAGDAAMRGSARGKVGARHRTVTHGRRLSPRAGMPQGGARLDLVATLRAAAPWQMLRERSRNGAIAIRRDDLRVMRFEEHARTTTIFLVDASGSAARERLAEAKGAVRLMLADCYIRRDEVALIAFRTASADLLLPPTRSLVRAERALAALPGGGGTPLAAGLDAAALLAQGEARKGRTPTLVVMSDGRANVARDGLGGRPRAHADALEAAAHWRVTGFASAFLDTGAAQNPLALTIAQAMGARYVPLPFADARGVDKAVRRLAPA